MEIRPLGDADVPAILALNDESVWALSPMGAAELTRYRGLHPHVVVCTVEGLVAAFAIAYPPGSAYDSANYRWHSARFDDFLYLDRIAVGRAFRRRGIASRLYDQLETVAAAHTRMVCEVNSDPPNLESLAFHTGRGYRELGHLCQADGHQTVMLEKLL